MAALVAAPALSADYVRGYTKSNGTYVAPHYRSDANTNRYDNYSSQGNSNPYTGQQGSQRNEFSSTPQWNNSYGNGTGEALNKAYGNDK